MRPSNLYNGNPYAGKMISLYWNSPLDRKFKPMWEDNLLIIIFYIDRDVDKLFVISWKQQYHIHGSFDQFVHLLCTFSLLLSKPWKKHPWTNKPNLKDLIAATGLVILLKFDPNHRIFSLRDLEIWWMTLKNNRAPLLCYFKLCATFRSYWIQTEVTVRKQLSWVLTSVTLTFDLWPCPFAWTPLLSLAITPGNFMMIQWWEHSQKGVTDSRTDRQTEWTVHRAAWSQLKTFTRVLGKFGHILMRCPR